MLFIYFVKGLWGTQCVQSVLYKLETGGERKEGVFAGEKLAKIFLAVMINRFFFWALNGVFVFKLSGFQGGLPGIDARKGCSRFPERTLKCPVLHCVLVANLIPVVFSPLVWSLWCLLCVRSSEDEDFSRCLGCAQCFTKVMGLDGQVLETSVPTAATGASQHGRALLLWCEAGGVPGQAVVGRTGLLLLCKQSARRLMARLFISFFFFFFSPLL